MPEYKVSTLNSVTKQYFGTWSSGNQCLNATLLSTDALAVNTAQVIFVESSGKVTLREVTNNRTILTVSERQGKSKSFTVLVQSYVYISAV